MLCNTMLQIEISFQRTGIVFYKNDNNHSENVLTTLADQDPCNVLDIQGII